MKHRWNKQHRSRAARHEGELREGVIQHSGHFAFLIAEKEGDTDVFLRGRGLALAMDGDRVLARVRREEHGRYAGEIVKVLTHAHTSLVGILKQFPHGWAVIPEKGSPAQVIGFEHKVKPAAGAMAVLKVTCWPTETSGAAGRVIEVLGDPEDTTVRITMLLREKDICEEYPKEALAESRALPERLAPELWKGREELFPLTVFTVDGADAKDFDDAVSLEPLGGGLVRLGVHIADVSHYVKPGSALDKEAYERGTSVYLPDRVVPMLPPSLSNNLCSLVPYQERLTVSVFMDIDEDGRVKARRMANTVIRSCRRFTYEEVQTLLDGGKVPDVTPAVLGTVQSMGKLTDLLHRQRIRRGALDFEFPEYKVQVDERGRPLRVVLRPRLKSHRLIEEFMLLANESIATELMAANMPFLHRRHDEPDPLKLQALVKTLGELDISAAHLLNAKNTHKALQEVLRQAENHPLAEIINSLIVRSMKQAVYSPESSGHFGIAARAYAHFTSPIRRYPDLTAHRAVKALLCGTKEKHLRPLAEMGVHCSERERAATEAERKSVDIMRAELFKDRIGAVMEGMVTTVVERGSFVLCGDTGVEGMLRVTHLTPGTKVKVMVEAVDVAEGKIDLSLAEKPYGQLRERVRIRRDRKRRSFSRRR